MAGVYGALYFEGVHGLEGFLVLYLTPFCIAFLRHGVSPRAFLTPSRSFLPSETNVNQSSISPTIATNDSRYSNRRDIPLLYRSDISRRAFLFLLSLHLFFFSFCVFAMEQIAEESACWGLSGHPCELFSLI